MTTPITVVDASVALKWVLDDEGSQAARRLIGVPLAAPDLLLTECANAIWRRVQRGDLAAALAPERLGVLRRALVRLAPSVHLLDHALAIAVGLRHPVYDCLYVALGVETGGTLVTDDSRLVNAMRRRADRVVSLADWPR